MSPTFDDMLSVDEYGGLLVQLEVVEHVKVETLVVVGHSERSRCQINVISM